MRFITPIPARIRWWHLALVLTSLFSLSSHAQTEAPAEGSVDESKVIASDFDDNTVEESPERKNNIPAKQRLSQQHRKLLEAAKVKPIPIWLDANTHQILGFWQEDLSGSPAGAVLILHDTGESPITPATMLNLQQHLPQESWATLSIELPDPAKEAIPKRPPLKPAPAAVSKETDKASAEQETGESEDRESNKTDETQIVHDDSADQEATREAQEKLIDAEPELELTPSSEDINRQAIANIQAAIDYLRQQGQYNIVVLGEGYGALRALQYAQQGQTPISQKLSKKEQNTTSTAIIDQNIRAIVLLNAQNGYTESDQTTLDLLELGSIPLLDVYTHTNRAYLDDAQVRKIEARKRKLTSYRQKKLTPAAIESPLDTETQLTKTIRGFLNRFAKGKEL